MDFYDGIGEEGRGQENTNETTNIKVQFGSGACSWSEIKTKTHETDSLPMRNRSLILKT
jgi:hypothetical protein